MSTVAEIEAAIEKLSSDEFAKLAEWMAAQGLARQPKESAVEAGDFRKRMDKVFTHHAPLLGKLAPITGMREEPFFLEWGHGGVIHKRSLEEHGGSDGIRNFGGLGSAVM